MILGFGNGVPAPPAAASAVLGIDPARGGGGVLQPDADDPGVPVVLQGYDPDAAMLTHAGFWAPLLPPIFQGPAIYPNGSQILSIPVRTEERRPVNNTILYFENGEWFDFFGNKMLMPAGAFRCGPLGR